MKIRVLAAALISVVIWTSAKAQQTPSTLERCLQAALAEKPGAIVKLEVEIADSSTESGQPAPGTKLLEIETRDADSEWELTCEEQSGRIIEVEQEVPNASHPAFQPKVKVTEKEAQKTVLAAEDGEIVEVEYEIEANGAASYEFDVKPKSGSVQRKIEVDATTGKIVERRTVTYQIGIEPSAKRSK